MHACDVVCVHGLATVIHELLMDGGLQLKV